MFLKVYFAYYSCRLRSDAKVNKKDWIKIIATVHSWRHFFTVYLLEYGTDILYKRKFLGYSSIKSTWDYNHLIEGAVHKIQSPLIELNNMKNIEYQLGNVKRVIYHYITFTKRQIKFREYIS
jgi:integrase